MRHAGCHPPSPPALPPSPPLCSAQEALEEFRMLMQTADDEQLGEQLLLGATLIARHRHPLLQHSLVVDQLDDLAVQVWSGAGCSAAGELLTSIACAGRTAGNCAHTKFPAVPTPCLPAGGGPHARQRLPAAHAADHQPPPVSGPRVPGKHRGAPVRARG